MIDELKEEKKELIGKILSGASTSDGMIQLIEPDEKGKVFEGLLVLIIRKSDNKKLLFPHFVHVGVDVQPAKIIN